MDVTTGFQKHAWHMVILNMSHYSNYVTFSAEASEYGTYEWHRLWQKVAQGYVEYFDQGWTDLIV